MDHEIRFSTRKMQGDLVTALNEEILQIGDVLKLLTHQIQHSETGDQLNVQDGRKLVTNTCQGIMIDIMYPPFQRKLGTYTDWLSRDSKVGFKSVQKEGFYGPVYIAKGDTGLEKMTEAMGAGEIESYEFFLCRNGEMIRHIIQDNVEVTGELEEGGPVAVFIGIVMRDIISRIREAKSRELESLQISKRQRYIYDICSRVAEIASMQPYIHGLATGTNSGSIFVDDLLSKRLSEGTPEELAEKYSKPLIALARFNASARVNMDSSDSETNSLVSKLLQDGSIVSVSGNKASLNVDHDIIKKLQDPSKFMAVTAMCPGMYVIKDLVEDYARFALAIKSTK